ncbi:MAG: methyltransferase [Armatimonadetes bacterium]|nr:methyltransferase [Armatimonadota bacterium]
MDTHYTPAELAAQLVRSVQLRDPQVVADFTAGEGSLLDAASARWPEARLVATDIDGRAVQQLKDRGERWVVGQCDFLSSRSRAACRALRGLAGTADLVLLNPPFSVRGARRMAIRYADHYLRCSPAMAFALHSLSYLRPGGEARLILPAGALVSVRDQDAWTVMSEQHSVEAIGQAGRGSFPSCASNGVLVAVRPCERNAQPIPDLRSAGMASKSIRHINVQVTRGGFQMHRIRDDSDGPVLVHSSELQDGRVVVNGRRGRGRTPTVGSPAVLLPRVGRLTPQKIAIFEGSTRVMLSDCVLAVVPEDEQRTPELRSRMIDSFDRLQALYIGTGAPYVTLRRFEDFLGTIGVGVGENV